jgi:hypothetical protein
MSFISGSSLKDFKRYEAHLAKARVEWGEASWRTDLLCLATGDACMVRTALAILFAI